MPTWVCLIRGVNLGRQRKLPMAALRDSLVAAGLSDVRTYLQSGSRVIGNHVYVDYLRGYHNTHRAAPYLTSVLGVDGTERNWRTVLALADLLRQ